MRIQCISVGMFQANTYLVQDDATDACIVVDTGEDNELALRLAAMDPRPNIRAILITHAHIDHAGGLLDLQAEFDAPAYLPSLEKPFFDTLSEQGNWFGAPDMNRLCGNIDHTVEDGDLIRIENMEFKFLSTPGHSPGQGCYYTDAVVFVGDTLFAGSIGRTDLPGSNPAEMKASLRRLMELPGHLQVLSGHGPVTTLDQELETNPFLGFIRQEKGLSSGFSYPW
uniref:Glyoxylase, beta-lactamase superfamily II n=1 Tax=Candidatus Kentrum sp. FM TaxID=2126340 RepID=A0A450S3P0_9GAMM|nr:MAG: Glyoxylase, beta-lactamase superfamily II [Candidatus Kentron sp. FM]VFJ59909.1 MAG: Glyoxylase, beta-lactamase superfamily II [Candidatus Kentron sp. FM]VFK11654.1 MAG: Glyoxylase, beta-lactamase superfamily II [Candidatus Kentron sp. FM]